MLQHVCECEGHIWPLRVCKATVHSDDAAGAAGVASAGERHGVVEGHG